MDFMIVADKSYAIPSDLGDLAGRSSLQSLSYPAEMVPPFASNSLKHCRQDTDAMILPFKVPRTESLALDLLDSRPRNRIHGLSLPMVRYGRGAFTAEQWVELHRQVLIFKCITEGLSLPPALFLAFKSTICNLPGGSPYVRSQIVTDPEPGRCRRTDGKKWRCAREVVAHQKYCERHINRGRNRTRKIANSQASAAVQPLSNPTPPPHPFSNNPSHEASIAPIVGKSNTSPAMKSFLPSFTSLPAGLPTGAIGHKDLRFMSGGNLGFSPNLCNKNQSLQLLHNIPNLSLPCQMSSFAGPLNNHPNRLLVSTDICRDSDVQPHRSFLDDWPPSKNSAPLSWQCLEDDKHRSISSTHLSISTPAQFDCMLSSNGGSQGGKESPCCLKLFEESEGMGLDMGQQQKQQHSWVDISWEESVGGPLAEVLHSSSGKGGSGLDVLGDGWDASPEGSSSGGGSPRGVLKKHGFGSYSSDISSSSSSATSPATSFKLHPTSLG